MQIRQCKNYFFFFRFLILDFASLINFLTLEDLFFLLAHLPHGFLETFFLFFCLTDFLLIIGYETDIWTRWKSSSNNYRINLNLPICFKGYLLRAIRKLNKCRFRTMSYSPGIVLIAEHLT